MLEIILLPLTALVALGLWGSLFLIGAFILAIILTENDSPGIAALITAGACAVLWFFGIANVPGFIWNNPGTFFKWAALYLVVGVAWSGFKWFKLNREKLADYQRDKAASPGNIFESEATGEISQDTGKSVYRQVDTGRPKVDPKTYIPNKLEYVHNFFNWIILWWASAFWYFFSDFLADAIEWLVNRLGFYYDWIKRQVWGDLA